ncbi:hypothetical protein PVT71_21790 [Salipiger sp. H15]|uniref:Uncharacterized protein n=1 Tax=Alloyangia sp. H15 TaxID=3029062 RepID=A0AAU8AMX3_9RHOB
MTRITPEALYRLLPAVHRLRDAGEGGPLAALMAVLAREGAVVEENIEQLLDNLFIETCEDWAAPYIGGTIGYRALYEVEGVQVGTRAEVANTIGYRRRKGTAAVLEALARDVTGWPAHVVEYFQVTATCQHMNHVRPGHALAPRLSDPLPLESLDRAFDRTLQTVDVRSIQQTVSRRSLGGRHNFQNIGLWLWRLMARGSTRMPVTAVDARRYLFDPLGAPRQLVNLPLPEATITSISRPEHVPGDISRRALDADPALWYGADRALALYLDGEFVPVSRIEACDLSDDGPGWNHSPHTALPEAELRLREGTPLPDPLLPPDPPNAMIRIDPVLGRIAFPDAETREIRATWHSGFPGRIGGGEYNRARTLTRDPGQALVLYPGPDHVTLQSALDAVAAEGGIVELTANEVFAEPAALRAGAGTEVILRAANGLRPILRPGGPLTLEGGAEARLALDGVTVEGAPVEIGPDGDGASPATVTLRHVTLIPGLSFTDTGAPATPNATSLAVSAIGVELLLDRCITGPIAMDETTNAEIRDSIVDAAALVPRESAAALAISGPGLEGDPAGALTIRASTVVGRILARVFPLVSDSLLHARSESGAPVRAIRRQQGCMRFSFVPHGSVTPRRYRCQPQLAIAEAVAEAEEGGPVTDADRAQIIARVSRAMRPGFTSQRASDPAYLQLRGVAPREIRAGASDEGEMGAWHLLAAPQREANLRIRLEEYLRFGLEAGLFHET